MFFIIAGTNLKKREKAKENIQAFLKKKNIEMDTLLEVSKITKDNFNLLPSYFESSSLFGEKVLVNIEDIFVKEEARDLVYR